MTYRLFLDANVYLASLIGARRGNEGSATQVMVKAARGMTMCGDRLQLVLSHELMTTLREKLIRFAYEPSFVDEYLSALGDFSLEGPDRLDPYLVLGGREQFPIRDQEDLGIFATAVAARVDLLVTDNLKDFTTYNCATFPTTRIARSNGEERQLYAMVHETAGHRMVVAHSIDVVNWLKMDLNITPDMINFRYDIGTPRP